MGLIAGPPIRLADIANAEAFVQRTIDKSGISYGADEREELLAEGLALLYELHGKYRPMAARPGIDKQAGRFSGYAAMFLPRRLGDAWHKMHGDRYITDQATGKRGWSRPAAVLSLDALTNTNPEPGDDYGGERQLLHARTITAFAHTATLRLLSRATPLAAG